MQDPTVKKKYHVGEPIEIFRIALKHSPILAFDPGLLAFMDGQFSKLKWDEQSEIGKKWHPLIKERMKAYRNMKRWDYHFAGLRLTIMSLRGINSTKGIDSAL